MEVSEPPGYMCHVPSRVWLGDHPRKRGTDEGKGREGGVEREGVQETRREANRHRRGIGLDVSPYICGYVGVAGIGMPMSSFS